MSFDLSNYTTVHERIIQFYEKYPNGIISTHPAKVIEIGSALFISVVAEVTLDKNEPLTTIIAEAWEPYPGKTPYTKDSEQLNGATSSIGKALAQLGIGIRAGMASTDEVQHRAPVTQPKDRKSTRLNSSHT